MPRSDDVPNPARIAITGRCLDEVETRIEPGWDAGSVGYVSLTPSHHDATIDGDTVTLRLPPLTVIQLYFDGTLPVDRSIPVSLEIDGLGLGEFVVQWLRCAERHYAGEPMFLRLRAATPRSTRAADR